MFLERESQLEPQLPVSRISLYGQDPSLSGVRSSGLGRAGAPIVTQVCGCKRSYVLDNVSCKLCSLETAGPLMWAYSTHTFLS